MVIASAQRPGSRASFLVPTGLILLTLIPIVSGSFRLTQAAGGPQVVPEASRFTGSPLPVVLHIVSATLFCIVGTFQFLPSLRRGRRSWHKMAGRVLIPAGFIVALSGLWMATVYQHPVGDGPALVALRVVFGTYMLVSLVLAVQALRRRDYTAHAAWVTRAYALGVAAGTQALALIPAAIMYGSKDEVSRAVAMGAAWVVNLAVAELVIWRRTQRGNIARRTRSPLPAGSTS